MPEYLCDVNFLLSVITDRHKGFSASTSWLSGKPRRSLGLCRLSQLSLLRLLSNKSVMGEDVCTQKSAWNVWDTLLSDSRFTFCAEPPKLDSRLRLLTSGRQITPKLWNDAYLAAFALGASCRLVTFDKGFTQFSELEIDLLSESEPSS